MNKMNLIKRGTILEGPQWPGPLEIIYVENCGAYLKIQGTILTSRTFVEQIIHGSEIDKLKITDTNITFDEDSWKVFLAIEANRYKLASIYDPLLAMNTSKIDPLPHQIETVYGYILKLPRIRFLIADDPGAGKTIMAGLIIKELKLRNIIKNILIVTPGHLKDQWKRELNDRLQEKFHTIDRHYLDSLYGENAWERENQIITSIDFAKQEDIMRTLASVDRFDLVIVDEAHKMSAYLYGDKTQRTSRYKLGELLSKKSEHILFLTATPHKGDTENFRLFLDLLVPGCFATTDLIKQSIYNKDNPLFIRHMKEDLKDFEGRPLFLPRHVITKTFNLGIESNKEKTLYNDLSRYVETQYNKALSKDKRRNIAFALVILQRRFASSIFALLMSLERRKRKLEELIKRAELNISNYRSMELDEVEDMEEEERWKEEEIWESISVAENKDELQNEINTLGDLISQANEIIKSGKEAKLSNFREAMKELEDKLKDNEDKKILIFTESRDTLTYLEDNIKRWGYNVNTIHGGMKLEERIKQESVFRNESQVLVATEAAGEGINLQFCHLMINYDIPWNPSRLEQRMGRIHRYGQNREVYVINLVAKDTREGKILVRLFEKLEEIRSALGSDKVFDCLGEVLQNKNLAQLLLEAAASARSSDEIISELDIVVNDEYISKIKENLGESLATHFIDYTRIREMAAKARENRLIPEYTAAFFKKAFEHAKGKFRQFKTKCISIDSIPYCISAIAKEESFRRQHGAILPRYPKATFDKDIAFRDPSMEFISFGHPLFEAVMEWIHREYSHTPLTGTTFIDPSGNLDGYILFYEGEIKDGGMRTAGKRLFSYYVNEREISQVPPSILWDLKSLEDIQPFNANIESLKQKAVNKAVENLSIYQNELLKERERQGKVKEKYGIESLKYLINKLDDEILQLYSRQEKGENVQLPITNKQRAKDDYRRSLQDLEQQIQKEKSLSIDIPRFSGIVRIIPAPGEEIIDSMKSDADIEKIGMQIAMQHERSNNREPLDVSLENLGYDIVSKGPNETRYIEVKARAKKGDIALTQNEWFKAQRFASDYYLYIIYNASTKPSLYIINNPSLLTPEERIESVRYIISQSTIKEHSKNEKKIN